MAGPDVSGTIEMNCPLISIGMPVYNSDRFLKDAIKSVLRQTCQNFELIITDDGSTDDSAKIIESFTDKRIKFLRGERNLGISSRINQQVNIASGKFFVRMDADDIMFPNRIEEQFLFLKDNPKIDVVGSQAIVIDDDNQIIGYRECTNAFDERSILKKNVFIHPSVMGKTEWFKKNRYNSAYDGVEDYHLWVKAFGQSHFQIMDKPLLFYRDSTKLRFKTYMHRQRQLIKAYADFRKERIISTWSYLRLSSLTVLKIMAYIVFYVTGNASKLIKNRHRTLTDEECLISNQVLRNVMNKNLTKNFNYSARKL